MIYSKFPKLFYTMLMLLFSGVLLSIIAFYFRSPIIMFASALLVSCSAGCMIYLNNKDKIS